MTTIPDLRQALRKPLRLLLSGPVSSGAPATPADAATGGLNRVHLGARGLDAGITRLQGAGRAFRGGAVAGPGGRQNLPAGPADNLIELIQPAHRPVRPAEAS